MKKNIFSQKAVVSIIVIISACLISIFTMNFINNNDNKYNSLPQKNQENITIISDDKIDFLISGWELYPDVLLNPEDFFGQTNYKKYETWIGEYPNLSPFHQDKNPYGVATYRLFLSGDGATTIYLQEPLCATKIFIDGEQVAKNGSVTKYSPYIKDITVSFTADKKTELIIQTANYSHYYGGIWYPPIIGSADDVAQAVGSRLMVYGFLAFTSIALSVFCISSWFMQKKRDSLSFYFGALCLSFGIRVIYPFIRFFGVPLVSSVYALEDLSALVGIYCTLCISFLLLLKNKFTLQKNIAKIISFGMCVFTVLFPILVLPNFPSFTAVYGQLISWYKLIISLVLILIAVYGCLSSAAHSKLILTAVTVNAVSILYGVVSLNYFEPIIGAWPEEYGAYFMVICFVILMMLRNKKMVADNLHLTENLKQEVEEKTKHLKLLLSERGQMIAELGHDMKSPLSAFSVMSQRIQLENNNLDSSTKLKMQSIEHKCNVLSERLLVLQELTEESIVSAKMDTIKLNEFLENFHKINKPVVELDGPDFILNNASTPCKIYANEENISRVLENLIYNAADFTPDKGRITLTLNCSDNFAVITVNDTGSGIKEENINKIFDRHFTTRKELGGQGLGLAIARFIVLEHGGEITVNSAPNKGSTFSIKLPTI